MPPPLLQYYEPSASWDVVEKEGDDSKAACTLPVVVEPVPVIVEPVQGPHVEPPLGECRVHNGPGLSRVDVKPDVRLPQSIGVAKGVKRPKGVDTEKQNVDSDSEFCEEGENVFMELFPGQEVLTDSVRRAGLKVVRVDDLLGEPFEIMNARHFDIVKKYLRCRRVR